MADFFISYSRTDRAAASALTAALKARQVSAWIDLKDIPPSLPWQEEASQAIVAADAVLLLISPAFLQSSNCHWEVDQAIQNNKRLIPVILADVDAQAVPAAARSLNWVFLRPADDFNGGVERIIEGLRTDPDWLHTHTRLLQRALEWERRKGEASLLLQGRDLEEAEKWLASAAPAKNPAPHPLHTRYIIESRRDSTRRARRTTLIISAGLLLTILLAIFAWTQRNASQLAANQRATAQIDAENGQREALIQKATAQAASTLAVAQRSTAQAASTLSAAQRSTAQAASTLAVAQKNEAVRQAQLTHSGLLVAQAITQLFEKPDLALLLSVESSRLADTFSSRSSLYTVLDYTSNLSFYLRGHSGAVDSLAFSPDGSRLVSGSEDGDVRVWDTTTGKLLSGPIHTGETPVFQIIFSPDGRFMITLSQNSPLLLWDTTTGQSYPPMPGAEDGELNSVAFSLDGKLLVTSSNPGVLRFYNTETLQLIYQSPPSTAGRLASLAFSPNGRYLAMFDTKGSVREWDVLSRAMYGDIFRGLTNPASNLGFSPDGKYLAAGDFNSGILLWDANTHQAVARRFSGHTDLVNRVVFSPDSRYLISGSADKTVRAWDVETGQAVLQPYKQDSAVTSLAISADGAHLASGAASGIVYQWNPSYLPAFETLTIRTGGTLAALEFSPQGNTLSAAGDNAFFRQWDMASGQPLPAAPGGDAQDYYERLAISSDGQVMAVSIWKKDILLLDPAGKLAARLAEQEITGRINDLAFSPDGHNLAAASSDGSIYLWDLQAKPPSNIVTGVLNGGGFSVAFSPDGKLLAGGAKDGTVSLWDCTTRQQVGQALPAATASGIVGLAFSPDGKSLVAAAEDGVIVVRETGSWTRTALFNMGGTVSRMAFSPDGRLLAAVGRFVHLWDMQTLQPMGQPVSGRDETLVDLAFSADGRKLAFANVDGTIHIWDLDIPTWQQAACRVANRNLTEAEWALYFPGEAYHLSCGGE